MHTIIIIMFHFQLTTQSLTWVFLTSALVSSKIQSCALLATALL